MIKSKKYPYCSGNGNCHDHRLCGENGWPSRIGCNQFCCKYTQQNATQAPQQTQNNGLNQELKQYIRSPGTDRKSASRERGSGDGAAGAEKSKIEGGATTGCTK